MTLTHYVERNDTAHRPVLALLRRVVVDDGGDPGPAVSAQANGGLLDPLAAVLRILSDHPDDQLATEADQLWVDLLLARERYRDPEGVTA